MLWLLIRHNRAQQSVSPSAWGPAFWYLLHVASTHAVAGDARWKRIAKGLPVMVPCVECQTHARAFVEGHELSTDRREDVFAYWVVMHNAVNLRRGKPLVSPEDAARHYGLYDNRWLVTVTTEETTLTVDGIDPSVWSRVFFFVLFHATACLPVGLGPDGLEALQHFFAALPVLFPHRPSQEKLARWIARHSPVDRLGGGRLSAFPYVVEMYNAMVEEGVVPFGEPLTLEEAQLRCGYHSWLTTIEIRYEF